MLVDLNGDFMKMIKKALCFNDVLLVPKFFPGTSRKEIDLSTEVAGLKLKLPFISANMTSVSSPKLCYELAKLGGLGIFSRMNGLKEQLSQLGEFNQMIDDDKGLVGASIGIGKDCLYEAEALMDFAADVIVLDVAHAAQPRVVEVYEQFRKRFNDFPLIIGNYAGPDFPLEWFYDKKTAFKIGIGSGANCSTRVATACGLPTFESLLRVVNKYGLPKGGLISDGGHKNSGDCVRALAAGASAVMLGSIFAASEESSDKILFNNETGKKYKAHRGNASKSAKEDAGMPAEFIEGVETMVEIKGPLKEIVGGLNDGIKSGLSYCGALNLNQLYENAEFVEITSSGQRESSPHGLL